MKVSTIDFIVEEPSTEAFLHVMLPRILQDLQFNIYPFQGKAQMLARLPQRLLGYANWSPAEHLIVVLIDRDDDDCFELKQQLEEMARRAGLSTRSRPDGDRFVVINRIAVEELEAWYFGDWPAVCAAYPGVPATIPHKAGFRVADAISGGTWERLEQILQKAGYFKGGLRKIEVAQTIAPYIDPQRNTSQSFKTFIRTLEEVLRPGD